MSLLRWRELEIGRESIRESFGAEGGPLPAKGRCTLAMRLDRRSLVCGLVRAYQRFTTLPVWLPQF